MTAATDPDLYGELSFEQLTAELEFDSAPIGNALIATGASGGRASVFHQQSPRIDTEVRRCMSMDYVYGAVLKKYVGAERCEMVPNAWAELPALSSRGYFPNPGASSMVHVVQPTREKQVSTDRGRSARSDR